jgi:predicted phage terminase large subunit-like protein
MAALAHVDSPGYAAVIFRRTYSDLAKPGALMDRAHEWLQGTAAKWNNEQHQWSFPSGATVSFSYMQSENDKYNHQSAEYQFVGWDELTQFTETQYLYMFSRLRRLAGSELPLRVRSASNPGGSGHDWVKARFVDPEDPMRPFVRAVFTDNPHIDQEEYRRALAELDPVTYEQLLEGDWDVLPSGDMFKRETVGELLKAVPSGMAKVVRYWDKAGTEGGGDWTAGVLMGKREREFIVLDVQRGQWSAANRKQIMHQTATMDAAQYPGVQTWVEQEPGSSGKESAENTIADLAGFAIHAETSTGSKVVRANPLSAQWEVGNVRLLEGAWNKAYLDEMAAFPNGVHDDQVDGSSGAFSKLAQIVPEYVVGSFKYA